MGDRADRLNPRTTGRLLRAMLRDERNDRTGENRPGPPAPLPAEAPGPAHAGVAAPTWVVEVTGAAEAGTGFHPGKIFYLDQPDPGNQAAWADWPDGDCLVKPLPGQSLADGDLGHARFEGMFPDASGALAAVFSLAAADGGGGGGGGGAGCAGGCGTFAQNMHRGARYLLEVVGKTGSCVCVPNEPGTDPDGPAVPQSAYLVYDKAAAAFLEERPAPGSARQGILFCDPSVLHPVFYRDARGQPALVLRSADGTKAYGTTLECCDPCPLFKFGPVTEDCVVRFCTANVDVHCPKDDTVTFKVCEDCRGATCTTLTLGRTEDDWVTPRPLPPALLCTVKLTPNVRAVPSLPGAILRDCLSPVIGWPAGGVRFLLRPSPTGVPDQYEYGGFAYANPYTYQKFVRWEGGLPGGTAVYETVHDYRIFVSLKYCGRGLFEANVICQSCAQQGFGCGNFWSSTSGRYMTSLFQNNPVRDVFYLNSYEATTVGTWAHGEFEFDVAEVPTAPTPDPDCPAPALPAAGGPASPIPGACMESTGLTATPEIPAGTLLRLTGSGGLNVTASYAAVTPYGPFRAVFANPDDPSAPYTFRCGSHSPLDASSVHHTLALTNGRGGPETRPALTESAAGATFEDSLGVEYEVTIA